MSVKVRKRGSKWSVVIDYHDRQRSKRVATCEGAERVKGEVETRLALGDMGILAEPKKTETFQVYAERWLSSHAKVRCKPSTHGSYDQILTAHLFPRFGTV